MGYAKAALHEYEAWRKQTITEVEDVSSESDYPDDQNSDGWSDADPTELEHMMGVGHKQMPPGF